MLFFFPLHCNRVPITETNQRCSKRHVQPAQTIVKRVNMLQVYFTRLCRCTCIVYWWSYEQYGIFIEFVVLGRCICKSYCTLHAVWNINMLYPWQTGAVVEDTGLPVNLRSSEEQKEAEVYHHVMTVSSPQLQDTQNQASTLIWIKQSLNFFFKKQEWYISAYIINRKHTKEDGATFHSKVTIDTTDICYKVLL